MKIALALNLLCTFCVLAVDAAVVLGRAKSQTASQKDTRDSHTTLYPYLFQAGSQQNGQNANAEAGQAKSLTSLQTFSNRSDRANLINFCGGQKLTNGGRASWDRVMQCPCGLPKLIMR
jgi:hypothetical protein